MNLNAIAKWVTNEEAFPGRGTPLVDCHARSFQAGSHGFDIRAFQTEMTTGVLSQSLVFHRNVEVQPAGIKPNAAANTQGFGLCDFL